MRYPITDTPFEQLIYDKMNNDAVSIVQKVRVRGEWLTTHIFLSKEVKVKLNILMSQDVRGELE